MPQTPDVREGRSSFDPYYEWLQIDPSEQPATLYRLLGLSDAFVRKAFGRPLTEQEKRVVENAADQRMAHLRTFQTGRNSAECQRLLNEVSRAKITLLDGAKKQQYDSTLGQAIDIRGGDVRYRVFHTAPDVLPGPPTAPPPPPRSAPLVQAPDLSFLQDLQGRGTEPRGNGARRKTREAVPWYRQKSLQIAAGCAVTLAAIGSAFYGLRSSPKHEKTSGKTVARKTISEEELAMLPVTKDIVKPEPVAPAIPVPPPQPIEEPQAPPPAEPAPQPEPQAPPPLEQTPPAPAPQPEPKPQETGKQPDAEQIARYNDMVARFSWLPTERLAELVRTTQDPIAREIQERTIAQRKEQEDFLARAQELSEQMLQQYRTWSNPADILAGGKQEQDPLRRTAILLVVIERAVRDGNLGMMDDAFNAMTDHRITSAARTAIIGDAYARHESASMARIGAERRLSIASHLTNTTWHAYFVDNYDLADANLATARAYLRDIRPVHFDARIRENRLAELARTRDAVAEAQQRTKAFRELHALHLAGLDASAKPRDAHARLVTGAYLGAVRRLWGSACGELAECDEPNVQRAAKFERMGPNTVDAVFACAQFWMEAGKTSEYADVWNQRAAYWLERAQRMNPQGKLKLDIGVAQSELRKRGVKKPMGTTQTSPEAEKFPQGKWAEINPALINPQKDELRDGSWTLQNGSLIQTQVDRTARLSLPVVVNSGSYGFKFFVRRANNIPRNDGAIFVSIPLLGNGSSARIDIDHMNRLLLHGAKENPLVSTPLTLSNNAWHSIEYSVGQKGGQSSLQVKIDGAIVLDYPCKPEEFGTNNEFPATGSSIILGCRTLVEFRGLQIRNTDMKSGSISARK